MKFFIRIMMMRAHHAWILTCGMMLAFVGCANQYPTHIAYTDTSEEGALVTGIQTYQFNLTTGPRYMQAGATAKDGQVGDKTGESTRRSTLFGLVEWGNNGVGEAASHGGIREVRTVQNGGIDILWGIVYSEQTTIVTGLSEYSNSLPIKFQNKTQVLLEGMFLEPNGNLVVKNSRDQVVDFVKTGQVARNVKVDQKAFSISYGYEAKGKTTILIEPIERSGESVLLINDQIVTFQPKGCLVVTLEDENCIKYYTGKPSGSVKIKPITSLEDQIALSGQTSK